MVLLTDLTIRPTFDQAKKDKQNLEKINSRKDPMNELKVTKIPKTKRRKYGMNETFDT